MTLSKTEAEAPPPWIIVTNVSNRIVRVRALPSGGGVCVETHAANPVDDGWETTTAWLTREEAASLLGIIGFTVTPSGGGDHWALQEIAKWEVKTKLDSTTASAAVPPVLRRRPECPQATVADLLLAWDVLLAAAPAPSRPEGEPPARRRLLRGENT